MVQARDKANANRDLARIFSADLVLRWAYQMGKTPVLPLFAAALGAAELMTGLIVAVSTSTGMVLKPLFGLLSDRLGRRVWLLAALCLFTAVPFLYRFVTSPEQLLALRLVHGFATAIFGPVSLAYVADMATTGRATRLAVFGMARSLAALGAPLSAGLLLTFYGVETVFTLIGFLSLAAAWPMLALSEPKPDSARRSDNFLRHARLGLRLSVETPAIWVAGLMELIVYLVTYGARAFLPLFILSQDGGSILQAGLFFTLQEAVHVTLRPLGGRIADMRGYGTAITGGLLVLAVGLVLLSVLPGALILGAALAIGAAQALIFPASVALLASGTRAGHQGVGMGLYGALRNIGKVLGPLVAGGLLTQFEFPLVFRGFAILICLAAVLGSLHQMSKPPLHDQR